MTVAGTQRISTRATGVVGVAILCSRVLGLIREVVFAAMFGASRNMDAFLTAFRAPNMLRDLFAEGALSTAFVTTFSRRIATEGERSAWDLASKVPGRAFAFGGDAPRKCRYERGGERAFGEKVAQHVGRAKRREKRVHVAARAEHRRENHLANQSQNAATKNRHANHTGRA